MTTRRFCDLLGREPGDPFLLFILYSGVTPHCPKASLREDYKREKDIFFSCRADLLLRQLVPLLDGLDKREFANMFVLARYSHVFKQ